MKRILKKLPYAFLVAAVLATSAGVVSCKSSEKTMYERNKSNKGSKVKSNIKVKGSSKTNGHTTRSY